MSKKVKPLNVDKFAEKYNKPGNKFYILKANKPIQDPDTKRTHFVEVTIQLVLQKNGKIAAREV